MNTDMEERLDNPVWSALTESHLAFAGGSGPIRYYEAGFSPFVGTFGNPDASVFDEVSHMDVFYMVGDLPGLPPHIQIETELRCLQMLWTKDTLLSDTLDIIPLTEENAGELSDLVNLVQPGLFSPRTRLMGDYYGIFEDGKLVSVSGERLKTNLFTEVSSVINHPDYLGKGYAGHLVSCVTRKIHSEGRLPMLHVLEVNTRAIRLYEKLGYTVRRKISFWKMNNLMF